jgi:hypothetical protein
MYYYFLIAPGALPVPLLRQEREANSLLLTVTDPETYCTFMTTQLLYC